jgi:ribose transport system substrate-binding protein
VRRDGTTRRAFLSRGAGLALAVMAFAGSTGLPGAALSAEGSPRGKRVGYITFGLQFEYQVAMVEGIKTKAADAGLVLQIVDGKGDPNLQVTEVLDAVTKQPVALLINPVVAKLIVAGVNRATEANIPVFIIENPPPEG